MSSGFVKWMVLNEPRRREGREGREKKEFTSCTGKVRIAHLGIGGSADIRNVWRSTYLNRQLK
jgi:hypothetical protein